MSTALGIQSLQLHTDRFLFECDQYHLAAGKTCLLIGENGTGKTSLFRAICGLHPYKGKIMLGDRELKALSHADRACRVAVAFAGRISGGELTVSDALSVSIMARPVQVGFEDWMEEVAECFSLKPLMNKFLYQLSDGEHQRVMVARAFSQDTPLVLLDEPTAFLDYHHKRTLFDRIRAFALQRQKAVLFSSHDLEAAIPEADEILWLKEGKLSLTPLEEARHLLRDPRK